LKAYKSKSLGRADWKRERENILQRNDLDQQRGGWVCLLQDAATSTGTPSQRGIIRGLEVGKPREGVVDCIILAIARAQFPAKLNLSHLDVPF
jgi:hypothetical protein